MTTTEQPPQTKECPACGITFRRPKGVNTAKWATRRYCTKACSPVPKARTRHTPTPVTVREVDPEWRTRAACRGEDPELFFPVGTSGPAHDQTRAAKRVCRRCPVRDACLTDALNTDDHWAIRGGLTPAQRARLPKTLQLAEVPA